MRSSFFLDDWGYLAVIVPIVVKMKKRPQLTGEVETFGLKSCSVSLFA